ncbi:TonB-dependent receptor [Cellvibrio japonicus]|uniref:TonB-dependent receptor n=1 Tax=Cellvibrio japonicus (strain Ueda107) TaxID=498211 RepID=B3PH32_CELJU|nr:TonB-dependent receptor [Cellvibrio japonicus]ACE86085.1 TonB-dependent receptor [Cellvibrio japonicus Ueda107]QEI13832.1 TonB-dependent receptor [Cellvibrio japonicus]QEI17406.1 TonB-dependent receptor [Cellvibrio japonicus]QEI20982.1 TonB-dependent receptor [Cellvibrio japonicus]
MYKTTSFKKNILATVIASAALTGLSSGVLAQSNDSVEEVMVTGIRASLDRAMDVKRESAGVVDSINSEDIGKFPDTNLAESLQRITGVSISRQNGEGSEVTVRGFGPENNMITLNGRTMPTGTTYAGGSGADGTTRSGGSRAFNFANLASDNIAGVEVYKTSKANIATGGIGATINVKTARPLDNPGFNASIGAKALHDTTNVAGDDITPEVSGLISWSDDNDVFGASLALSSQERNSGSAGVTVNNWNIGVWGQDFLYDTAPESVFVNAPEAGQLYARPNDFRYAFSDFERERLNGQLTFQYRPAENITATVDYTYADTDLTEHRGEVTNWIQNGSNIAAVVFDDSEIATPLSITEAYSGTVDIGYEQQFRSQSNTLKSVGINLDVQISDEFKLVFDAHDSSLESLPTGPGKSGEVAIGLGSPTVSGKTLDFSRSIPTYGFVTTVPDNNITEDNVGSSILRVRGAGSVNDITQIKLDGAYQADGARFDFGIEARDMEMKAYQTAEVNQALGNWGIANPGEFAGMGVLERINVHSMFDDFNVGNSPAIGFRGDAVELTRISNTLYPDSCLCVADANASDDYIEEKTQAFYLQVGFDGEIGQFPISVLTGLRYETTDVTSSSVVTPVAYMLWENNNDFSTVYTNTTISAGEKASYDHLLPSLDLKMDLTENLVARAAFSKTIARADFGDMSFAPSEFDMTGSTFNGYLPTATSGNPGLLPLESNNFDLSIEYYFDDSSYASVGFFEKRVINFIGQGQELRSFYGIRDQSSASSQRVQAAVAELRDLGLQTDDTNLYAMMVLQAHPEALNATNGNGDLIFPNGVFEGTGEQLLLLGETNGWDIAPNGDDPESEFLTSTPVNDKEAKIYGAEFAVQHFFGDTGFGVLANYTLVRGDVKFNNTGSPEEAQFALTGLSDTANLVLMYENHGIEARLAYNWRDKFLTETNQGSSRNPRYVEAYSQIDLSVSYALTDNLTISAEGINITGEDSREHNRNSRMLRYADDLGARYALGMRYKF